MNRLKLQDEKLLALTSTLPDKFALLPANLFRTYRMTHLVEEIIPKLSVKDSMEVHYGELEILLLEPLVDLFGQLKTDGSTSTSRFFAEYAAKMAIVSEVVNLANNKPTLDALADYYIKRLQSKVGATWSKEDGKTPGAPSSLSAAVLGKLMESATRDPFKTLATLVSYDKKEVDVKAEAASFETLFSSMSLTTGKGKGPSLPPAQARQRIALLHEIEIELKHRAARSSLTPEQANNWYAFGVAYATYLHMSQPNIYDSLFVHSPLMSDQRQMNQRVSSAAQKMAWLYSGLSAISDVADMTAALALIDNLEKFFAPSLDVEISDVADARKLLAKAREIANSFSLAPVAAHADGILGALRKMSGADILLPPIIKSFIPTLEANFTDENIEVTSHTSLTLGGYIYEKNLPPTAVEQFWITYVQLARDLRIVSESISYSINSFLYTDTPYDPNSLNIPNDLFSVDTELLSPDELHYSSPFHRQLVPTTIPRYVMDENGKPDWILKPYVNRAISVIPFVRAAQISSTPPARIVFDRKDSLPLGASLASRFALAPVPHNLVEYAASRKISPSIQDIESVLARSENPSLSHPIRFFHDWAEVFLATRVTSSDEWLSQAGAALSATQHHLLNVITSICSVYVSKINSNKTEGVATKLQPSIPTVYGVPTRIWLDEQTSLDQRKVKAKGGVDQSWRTVKTVEIDNTSGFKTAGYRFYFALHDQFVALGTKGAEGEFRPFQTFTEVSWDFDLGAFIKMTISYDLVSAILSPDYTSVYQSIRGMREMKELLPADHMGAPSTLLASLAYVSKDTLVSLLSGDSGATKLVVKTTAIPGWTDWCAPIPHAYHSVEFSRIGMSLRDAQFSQFVRVHYSRGLIHPGRQFRVLATQRREHVFIEQADYFELSEDTSAPGSKLQVHEVKEVGQTTTNSRNQFASPEKMGQHAGSPYAGGSQEGQVHQAHADVKEAGLLAGRPIAAGASDQEFAAVRPTAENEASFAEQPAALRKAAREGAITKIGGKPLVGETGPTPSGDSETDSEDDDDNESKNAKDKKKQSKNKRRPGFNGDSDGDGVADAIKSEE